MLCCGILALIAAASLGLWRRVRSLPRALALGSATLLVAVPVAAIGVAAPADHLMNRDDVVALSLRSLCGGHSGIEVGRPGERD
jgi:hypothetical protein